MLLVLNILVMANQGGRDCSCWYIGSFSRFTFCRDSLV